MNDAEERVREIANQVPAGEVISYGQIGRIAGLSPRMVGRIVARISESIPWWRVVRADGTPPACHGGIAGALLEQEHIPFRNGKIDWSRLEGRETGRPEATLPPGNKDAAQ